MIITLDVFKLWNFIKFLANTEKRDKKASIYLNKQFYSCFILFVCFTMLLDTANVLPMEEKWNVQPEGGWGVQKNSVPYYPEKSIFQTSSGPKQSGKLRVDCTSISEKKRYKNNNSGKMKLLKNPVIMTK